MIRRILVPVDFSQEAISGLEYALALTQQVRGELVVLHVFDWEEEVSTQNGAGLHECSFPPRPTLDRVLKDKSLDLFNFIQKVLGKSPSVRIKAAVRMGRPLREVVAVAKRERIDLIVLTTQKESLFSYLASSLAYIKLTWKFPGSVLLTPPDTGYQRPSGSPLKRKAGLWPIRPAPSLPFRC